MIMSILYVDPLEVRSATFDRSAAFDYDEVNDLTVDCVLGAWLAHRALTTSEWQWLLETHEEEQGYFAAYPEKITWPTMAADEVCEAAGLPAGSSTSMVCAALLDRGLGSGDLHQQEVRELEEHLSRLRAKLRADRRAAERAWEVG